MLPGAIFPIRAIPAQGDFVTPVLQVHAAEVFKTSAFPDLSDGLIMNVAHVGDRPDIKATDHNLAPGINIEAFK